VRNSITSGAVVRSAFLLLIMLNAMVRHQTAWNPEVGGVLSDLPDLFPPPAAARSLLRAASVQLDIGESRCAICCHTFRATGITAYLQNGGTLEHAQQIAAHQSPRTTKLYDRTKDKISLDEVERIKF
jgi:integrase